MSRGSMRNSSAENNLEDPRLPHDLIDSLPDQVYVKDTEGRYLFSNAGHLRSLGVASREEVVGKTDFDFCPRELAERYRADEQEVVRTGRPLIGREEPGVDGDGNERWHSTTKAPLRDDSGKVVGLVGVTRDVTEHREAEKALRESEGRFRQLFKRSTDALLVHDEEGRMVDCNEEACRSLGYTREELLQLSVQDFAVDVLSEGEKRARKGDTLWARAMAAEPGTVVDFHENEHRRKDGTTFPVEVGIGTIDYGGRRLIFASARDLTERKRAEEALKESEERYRTVMEQSVETIYLYDAETKRVLESNAAFRRLMGYSEEELLGMRIYDFIDHDKENIDAHVRRSLREGRRHIGERRYRRKDGSVLVVETSATVISYGGKTAICAVSRDITERREVEEALRKSEERFRSLIQNASDIITILEADGTIRYESPAIERVLGYKPEERIGKKVFEYMHPDDGERVERSFAEALDNPGVVQSPIEFRLRHKDGSWRHVEVTRTNLLDDPAVRGVVANARDVTERTEAEEKYRDIFENAAEGIYQTTPDGRFISVNPALARLFGYASPEEVNTTVSDLGRQIYVDPSRRDEFVRLAQENEVVSEFESQIRRKDGSIAWVSENARAVYDADGTLLYYEGFVEDITRRKRIEEALRISEMRLRTVIEQSPLAIQLITPDGNSLLTNAAWEELWNLGEEEVQERANVFEDERLRTAGLTSRIEGSIVSGVAVTTPPLLYDRARTGGEGNPRWLRGFVYPVLDDDERTLEVALVLEDVTERKHTEEALKESEERHRALVEQSVEAIYLFDPDTKRILESNPAFEDLIGYTSEELCEMTIYDFVAHDKENIDRNVERHVVEERRFVGERRYRRKDDRLLEVEVSATMIPYHGEEAVCCVVRDVTERQALEEQLRHQAFHDSLTELPNRALLLDRLEHALARAHRNGGPVALLLMDLDDFKIINDSLGHDAGNAVLVEVAERLKACVRPGDTVGRLFGDEFAVLLEAPADLEDARRATERIQERFRAPFAVDGREVFVGPSVGIAIGDPARDRPKDVLRHADLAMYEAKNHGKSRYEVFAPSMRTRATERLDMESDLRRAVEREEFDAYYQPVIDLRTSEIDGFEALARWEHPERGLVAAEEFIRLAEETGLIRPIGEWVFEKACRQAKEWREQYPDKAPLMSVNLSAAQFAHQPDLIPQILNNTGLDPESLQLEITERAVMDDAEFALGKLQNLKGLGVSFAIDDYGMGYSCLYYLKRMPVDFLKIDSSFIAGLGSDPGDQAIVSGTIGMGHALGLKVVAEGVETAEQLQQLRGMGCDLAQGFYFAKPLPGEAAERLLVEGASW